MKKFNIHINPKSITESIFWILFISFGILVPWVYGLFVGLSFVTKSILSLF